MLDRSDALSLGRFGSASAPKLGVFPLDGMLGSVNKSLSTGTRIPKRVIKRQFTCRYICLCYSGRKRYNPSPGSSRYSHKGSIGPGGTCFLGAGAGYPLRALLGQDEKLLNTHGPRRCAWQGEAEPMIVGRAHDSHARRLLVGRQS